MRMVLIATLLTLAVAVMPGCSRSKTDRCSDIYAGTIGVDGCRTESENLRSDGQFRDRGRHCQLWTVYHGATGRCKGWRKQKTHSDHPKAPSN
jgi:hypothetical protein